jgi:hypothetical protein
MNIGRGAGDIVFLMGIYPPKLIAACLFLKAREG